jgi:glycosyltransferase involved in cell wall biosynthesis
MEIVTVKYMNAVGTAVARYRGREFDPREDDPRQASPHLAKEDVLEVSVVMPCLNESETLAICIGKAQAAMDRLGLRGEVVIADNGSTDGSQQIAESMGARVVPVERRGYGAALQGGIAAARGEYILMGDADDSYDFAQVGAFVEKLREGHDLVMGNRFQGEILPGAMPALHRYLGNPVLTAVGQLFFACPVGDFHCGLRAFRRDAIEDLQLRTTGMEFASEMVVKATRFGLRMAEIPTTLSPDGRSRAPHLRTWRDGWRHLRFLLLYSPRWLFLYPGIFLFLLGTVAGLWLLPGPRVVGRATLDIHTLLFASAAVLIGFESITFAVFSKVFAVTQGLLPEDPALHRMFRVVTLESGLIVGGVLALAGAALCGYSISNWGSHQFGPLDPSHSMRIVIPGLLCLTLGVQTILSSFFLSVLGMARR